MAWRNAFYRTKKMSEYLYYMSRMLVLGTKEILLEQLENLLSKFSQLTSGDGISIACICNTRQDHEQTE